MVPQGELDLNAIMEILPHRYPFLLVDKIIELSLERKIIVGQKNVTMNESFFQGHFPGIPIMPGVLILEALAQTGGVYVYLQQKEGDKLALLLNVKNAKFRHRVKPGDILTLHCKEIYMSAKGGRIQATAKVQDQVAVDAEIGFVLVNKKAV